jgi:hypothetical protein
MTEEFFQKHKKGKKHKKRSLSIPALAGGSLQGESLPSALKSQDEAEDEPPSQQRNGQG